MNYKYILTLIFIVYSNNIVLAQKTPKKINKLDKKCLAGDTISCEKLIDIAKNHKSFTYRYHAIDKLTDKNVLVDIAKNDRDSNIRRAAVWKISDQNILADIYKNDRDNDVRRVAVNQISDQNILADIYKNDRDRGNRNTALKNISDNNILADIVNNEINNNVRLTAIKKISDQNILLNIAENHKEYCIRMAAINILTDENVLSGIIERDTSQKYMLTTVKEIQDQNILLDIAKNGKHIESRLFALNSLNGEEYYEQIVAIINENKDIFHNLAVIGALKIIPYDKTLSKYFSRLYFSTEFENLVQIENINDWKNIKFKTFLSKTYIAGKRQIITFNELVYSEVININEICEDFLSLIHRDYREALIEISNESDVYYLREAAKSML